ncbi:MAG TPA: 5-formyltetrahydrofolate cyclo-ligase [Chthoniobacterales bacterium]|nr:5-formyltetrahydrofolate cyclo-ligase [Chthoniobacterales bacterium]
MSDDAEIAAQKTAIRAAMLAQLRAMPAEERAARSEVICRRIVESPAWRKAERLLLFSPIRSEPDIAPVGSAATDAGKRIAIMPTTLRTESQLELPFIPDLVLVPGLAFTPTGQRLGRGGGFYDRLLTGRAANAYKVGICFASQLLERIPTEEHDAVLDAVITD